jgi:hypothetical protein
MESSLSTGDEAYLWPLGWWRAGCRLLAALEARKGVFFAGLAAAVFAEGVSFLFASSWYTHHAGRFTGLSLAPFAVGEVPIPYAEHRLRLLGPVIAWAVGLGGSIYGALIPVLGNIPLLALAYLFVRQRSSIQMGLVSVLLLATTHLTMSSRTLLGYHDSLVYLCCLGALMTRGSLLRGLLLFLALYGDVRAVLVFPFILIWPLSTEDRAPAAGEVAKRAVMCATVLAMWAISARGLLLAFDYDRVLSSRVTGFGFLEPVVMVEGDVFDAFDPYILHLSVWVSFKAAWLFMFVPIVIIARRSRLMAAYLAATFIGIAGAAFLVHDISRAMALGFPLILLGLIELWRRSPRTGLVVAGTCLAVNLTSPFYHGMTWGLWLISYPLPLELIRRIF